MDFTREPIIETVITPREGCKIVVRSSKVSGQEEFFVDALEVVSFGHSQFFRSLEKPKPFLVPTSDYEVLEVREARMVLKSVGIDRSIKIGGGRDSPRLPKEREKEKDRDRERVAPPVVDEPSLPLSEPASSASDDPSSGTEERPDARFEKRRDRRRHYRRRRGREEAEGKEETEEGTASSGDVEGSSAAPDSEGKETAIQLEPPKGPSQQPTAAQTQQISSSAFSSLLSPPPNLISETIARYRDNEKFKGAFYPKEPRPERRREEMTEISEQSVTEFSVEEPFFVSAEASSVTPQFFVEEPAPVDAGEQQVAEEVQEDREP